MAYAVYGFHFRAAGNFLGFSAKDTEGVTAFLGLVVKDGTADDGMAFFIRLDIGGGQVNIEFWRFQMFDFAVSLLGGEIYGVGQFSAGIV